MYSSSSSNEGGSSSSSNEGGNLLHRKQLKMRMKRKMILIRKNNMRMLKRKKTWMLKRKKSRQHYQQSQVGMFKEIMKKFDGLASALVCGVPPVGSFSPAKWDKDAYGQLKVSASKLEIERGIHEHFKITASELKLDYTMDPFRRPQNASGSHKPAPAPAPKQPMPEVAPARRPGPAPKAMQPAPPPPPPPPPYEGVRSDVPPLELIKNRGLNSPPPVPTGSAGSSGTKPSGSKWNILSCLGKQ